MSSSYNNVANLGIPIATAVLHDATAIVPALIFQIAFYAPISLTILDILTSRHSRLDIRRTIMTPLKNPIFVGAALGLLAAALPFDVPTVVMQPIGLLGQAAVPLALLAFGVGLYGSPVLRRGVAAQGRARVFLLKNIGQPVAAYLIGVPPRDGGHALLAAVVIAALDRPERLHLLLPLRPRHGAGAGLGDGDGWPACPSSSSSPCCSGRPAGQAVRLPRYPGAPQTPTAVSPALPLPPRLYRNSGRIPGHH